MNKTVTRHSIFESNSSSSHSISIATDGALGSTSLPVQDYFQDIEGNPHHNCVVLTGGEFGWGIEEYSDAFMKANYLAVYLKIYAETNTVARERFERVIKDATGADEIIYDFNNDNSYIDHQSLDVPMEPLSDESALHQFLFSRASILTIDNDNH